MSAVFAFADKRDFLQRCRLLMMIRRLDDHEVRVAGNKIVFGREYIADKSVNKRSTEERLDG